MNETGRLEKFEKKTEINSVLVDDNKTILDTLGFILENLGRKVWLAGNGEEAIKEIKKINNNANIIIITAFSGDNNVRELARTDSIKIIDKPFEIAEIKKCV